MTGGSTFSIQCQKDYTYKPSLPVVKYGVVIDEPEVVIKYGVGPIVELSMVLNQLDQYNQCME